jgi:[ribosomal protein S5]-alanine N-acetyltransferase
MHIEIELDCGSCGLRPLRKEDAPTLARYADNPKVASYLRDRFPHPYSTEDAVRFFEYATHAPDECVACIEVGREAAGAIGLQFRKDVERCSAELGYWIGEQFWGRGVMTAAIRCFTAWAMPCFELTRVYAEVFVENPASGRALEKSGFVRVGVLRKAAIKHGLYHDYVLYDLVR